MIGHTELPWKIAEPGDAVYEVGTATICTADGQRSICDIVGSAQVDTENAQFILQACNSFSDVVESVSFGDLAKAELSGAYTDDELFDRATALTLRNGEEVPRMVLKGFGASFLKLQDDHLRLRMMLQTRDEHIAALAQQKQEG